jgi:PBP1b-binding outer membrane lipoprotein LpoB
VITQKQFVGIAAVIITALTLVGCSKKTDASSELAKTVKVLEQPTASPQSQTQASANAPTTMPAQQVSQALTSLKEGKYTETIVHMEMARYNPNKTPQQMIAIQDAMAAVMSDLYARAASGDAPAKQAIKQYQENRNKR